MTAEPTFHLLRPENLPSRAAVLAFARAAARGRSPAVPPAVWDGDDRVALAGVRAALTNGPARACLTVGGADPAESVGNRDNDRVFDIVRVDGDRPWLLLRSVLMGYEMLLDDANRCGTGLTPAQWAALRGGVAALLGYLSEPDGVAIEGEYRVVSPRAGADPAAALRRWIRGHRLFMVLIQGLGLVAGELTDGLWRADVPGAAAALDLAVALMHACESALRFASDFTPDEYEGVVRPTLMPPAAPDGLSGLHWRDHEHMIERFAALRQPLAELPAELAPLRARFRAAYSAVYDAHRLVCARFVGEDAASLLMTSRSKQSAVGVLARYQRVRLQHIPD